MNHTYLFSRGSGDDIDFGIYPAHGLFKDDHAEYGSAGADIPGPFPDTVCCCHAGSGVSLGRAERASGFKIAGRIEQPGAFSGQRTGILTGTEYFRQDPGQLPGIMTIGDQFIEGTDHGSMIGACV